MSSGSRVGLNARHVGVAVALLGTAVIAVTTLVPRPAANAEGLSALCLRCNAVLGADLLLNVALFLPLGFGLALAGLPRPRALLAVVAATLAVEVAQATIVTGRNASILDLFANTAGGAIGAALAGVAASLLFPSPRAARRMAWVGAVVAIGVFGATAGVLHISGDRAHDVNIAPRPEDNARWFSGTVVSAALGGAPLATGPATPAISRSLADPRGAALRVVVTPGAPTTEPATIVAVNNRRGRELVELAQDERALRLMFRTRSAFLGLRSPMVRIEDFFPLDASGSAGTSPDTIRMHGRYARGRIAVGGFFGGAHQESSRVYGITDGAALLIDPASAPLRRAIHLIWLAALLLPASHWAGRGATIGGTSERVGALLPLALIPAAGILLPPVGRLLPLDGRAWLTMLALLAAGVLCGVVSRRVGTLEATDLGRDGSGPPVTPPLARLDRATERG